MRNKSYCFFCILFLAGSSRIFAQRTVPSAYPVGINVNSVKTWDATAPETNSNFLVNRPLKDVKMTTQYVDGLGRQLQQVTKQGSLPSATALATDIVQPIEYDEYGREQYKYLPYADPSATDGSFKMNPFGSQASFMNSLYSNQGETYFYGQEKYESSPLNRVEKSLPPGNSWVGNNRGTETKHFYNTTIDNVKIWDVKTPVTMFATVTNLNNGTQSVTWGVNSLSSGNINVITYLYRPSGSTGSWTTAYAGNPAGGSYTSSLTLGNYEYAVQVYYTDGTPSVLIGEGSQIAFASYSTSNSYPAGSLFKNIQIDENNKQVIEFINKEGLVILKKVQLTAQTDEGPGRDYTGWLSTYYIYDDYNNLRCVIQPRAVELINSNWVLTDQTILSELCFRYEYDSRKHVIAKKTPGAATVYNIFDLKGRLVLTQDGNMRLGTSKWQYTQYDDVDRPIATGLWNNAQSVYYHIRNAYTTSNYPDLSGQTYEVLTQSFYDDYSWLAVNGNPFSSSVSTTDLAPFTSNSWPYVQAGVQNNETVGLATGDKIKILGTTNYLYSITFYDNKGRMLQKQSQNITGGTDVVSNQYGWAGLLLKTVLRQQISGSGSQTSVVITNNTYDYLGRIIKIEKKAANSNINSGSVPTDYNTVARYEYDALGRINKKLLGTLPGSAANEGVNFPELANQSYQYNIRSWMLAMNKDFLASSTNTNQYFGFEVGYDKNSSFGTFTSQYNGNVAGTTWKSAGDMQQRKYDFSYDAINRLTGATFTQYVSGSGTTAVFNNSAGVDFTVSNLTYDANGNILTMTQKGLLSNTSGLIDQLSYNYKTNSNKLLNVIDAVNASTTTLGDFRASSLYVSNTPTKTATTEDYIYDDNGNLIVDKNKDINIATNGNNGIIYNYLNLPSNITFKKTSSVDKGAITYSYDALGNKLKKVILDNSASGKTITTTTLYISGMVFESKTTSPVDVATPDYTNILQSISHEEGRIRYKPQVGAEAPSFAYDYFLKDYLGNVRMVLTEESKSDIYPNLSFEGAAGSAEVSNQTAIWEKADGTPFNVTGSRITNAQLQAATTLIPATGTYCLLVRNSTGKIGAGKLLKVMSGDKIHATVQYYFSNNSGGPGASLNTLVSALTNVLTNSIAASGGIKSNASTISSSVSADANATTFFNNLNNNSTPTAPKAYLNILFFDEQFKFDLSASYSEQIGANNPGQIVIALGNARQAKKNGYCYVYISNESNDMVYFDNLTLKQERSQLLEETHYYPFGLTMAGLSSKRLNIPLINKIKYNEKEEQRQEFSDGSGLELYDYGARFYDAQIGRWHRTDGKAELYFATSPYVYALNQPTNALDPDGNLVIFINGNHFDFSAPGSSYWRTTEKYVAYYHNDHDDNHNWSGPVYRTREIGFDTQVMNQLGDQNARYYDGSIGGWNPVAGNPLASTAVGRILAGYNVGKKDAKSIIANLARDKNSGAIIETIKIITHSMGGAYGKGFVMGLKEYIKTLPLDQQKQIKITLVADFDPYQAGDITADPDIKTTQYKHVGNKNISGMGWLANEDEKGLSKDEIKTNTGTSTDHSIFTFFNDISSLAEGTYIWDGTKWKKQ